MDWAALFTALIPGLAGPASAVFLCVIVLGFVGYITIKHVLPSVEKRFAEAQGNINTLMSEHKADRETFQQAISTLTGGQALMNVKVDALVEDVRDLTDKVDSVFTKVERIDEDIEDIMKKS